MAEQLSNSVFISYRRDVSQYLAMALWQNLTERGIDVFFDFESMIAGDFENIILPQIVARPYMIPVLTPGALRRCTDPEDWLRRVIEEALANDRVVVSVHTPEFDVDEIDRYLPEATAEGLRRFQMLEIPPRYFKYAIGELADKFLEPIALELIEAPAEAVAAADRQMRENEKAPTVTYEELSAEEDFARAYAHYEERDLEGAYAAFDEAIRLNPNDALAFIARGNAHYEERDLEGAYAAYDEAIRRNPSYAKAFNNRGIVRFDQGDVEAAIADFDEAILLDPNYTNATANRQAALKELDRQ